MREQLLQAAKVTPARTEAEQTANRQKQTQSLKLKRSKHPGCENVEYFKIVLVLTLNFLHTYFFYVKISPLL